MAPPVSKAHGTVRATGRGDGKRELPVVKPSRGPRWLLAALLTLLLTGGPLLGHPAVASPAPADLNAAQLQDQVAQVRGLSFAAAQPVTSLDRVTMLARVSRPINADQSIREYLTSQMLLEVLGAIPPGFDLRQLQLNLLAEQVLALYDHNSHTIYLVSDAGAGPTERLTLAHELTHALQDQAFDLGRILPDQPANGDASMASQALVEGDAMVTMRIWGRQYLRPDEKRSLGDDPTPSDPVLDAAPPLVRGELAFPYDAGQIFAQLLYQEGGFTAINQAFMDPPRSTEQILHPEKYAVREAPITVTIDPLEQVLGRTWQTRRTDVFGELVLRLLLEPQVGWPVAEAAAAGWGGDAYTILEDTEGRRIVGLVTVWDSDGDAAEFYNAYLTTLDSIYGATQVPLIAEPSRVRLALPEYQVQLLKTGPIVRLVYAPNGDLLNIVDAALAASTVSAIPTSPGPTAPRPSTAGPSTTVPSLTPTPTSSAPPPSTAAPASATDTPASLTVTPVPATAVATATVLPASTLTPTPQPSDNESP